MGLGDVFKGAVSAVVPDAIEGPVAQLIGYGQKKAGEEMLGNFQAGGRDPRKGNVGVAANQTIQDVSTVANNPVNAPYRVVGEQTEQYGKNKMEAAQGYYKLGKTLLTNPTEVWRGAKQFAGQVKEHPSILGHIAVEAGVATALDPMTYMSGGAAVGGAGIAERVAGRAGRRAVTEVAEEGAQVVARSADEVAASVASRAAREAAPEGLEEGIKATATRAGRQSTRTGRALESIDTGPANLRETLTGNPVGRLGQKRIDLGEKLMPGAQTSVPKALLKDALQSSPTLPTQGAGLGYRQAVWRAQQVGRRATAPGRIHTATRVGQILNDPVRALTDPQVQGWAVKGAEWVVKEHPEVVAAGAGLIAANQALGAGQLFKALKGGGEKEGASADEPYTAPPIPDTTQAIGLSQFRLDNTRSTRTSRRRPGGQAQLGMVTKDSTMPSHVGPKDWYGPQGGYDAGRGFQQRPTTPSGALPPLEQPQQPREMVGI